MHVKLLISLFALSSTPVYARPFSDSENRMIKRSHQHDPARQLPPLIPAPVTQPPVVPVPIRIVDESYCRGVPDLKYYHDCYYDETKERTGWRPAPGGPSPCIVVGPFGPNLPRGYEQYGNNLGRCY